MPSPQVLAALTGSLLWCGGSFLKLFSLPFPGIPLPDPQRRAGQFAFDVGVVSDALEVQKWWPSLGGGAPLRVRRRTVRLRGSLFERLSTLPPHDCRLGGCLLQISAGWMGGVKRPRRVVLAVGSLLGCRHVLQIHLPHSLHACCSSHLKSEADEVFLLTQVLTVGRMSLRKHLWGTRHQAAVLPLCL